MHHSIIGVGVDAVGDESDGLVDGVTDTGIDGILLGELGGRVFALQPIPVEGGYAEEAVEEGIPSLEGLVPGGAGECGWPRGGDAGLGDASGEEDGQEGDPRTEFDGVDGPVFESTF